MSLSAFADKTHAPQEDELAAVLGKAYGHWTDLTRRIAAQCSAAGAVWGFTSKNTGWGLRLKDGDRNIVYLTPCPGRLLASFALGEKAVRAAHEQGLPSALLAAIDAAPKYAEGRGVRFEVRSASDVENVCALAEIKLADGGRLK